jgi:hypothetical protein
VLLWLGIPEFVGRLAAHEAAVKPVLARTQYGQAQVILAASLPFVPVETGYLRSTGHVIPPVVQPLQVYTDITYDADYAVYVHERLDTAHAPPTRAKFLEEPALAKSGEVILALAAALRRIA